MDFGYIVPLKMLLENFQAVEQIVEKYGQAVIVTDTKTYLLKDTDVTQRRILPPKHIPELERLLRSIGKGIFVKYFWNFRNDEDPFVFMAGEHFTDNSLRSRRSNARTIFKNGWERDALNNIVKSDNVDPTLRARAAELLEDLDNET